MYNDVKEFGAVGDGVTKDTQAIQAALDAGGLVFFPPGTYLSGTLHLRSGGGLLLSPGATLLASPDPEDYNKDDFCPQNRVFQTEIVSGRHLIAAVEVKDIAICGGGRICGNDSAWLTEPDHTLSVTPPFLKRRPDRPGQMLFFCECSNITIHDVELTGATYWHCFLHGCENVGIHGIRIHSNPRVINNDGIDIDCCRQVTISDCIIETGDDCITLRGNSEPLKTMHACEYVTVSNCILSSYFANAIRVGVGGGEIRHCCFNGISIFRTRTAICLVSRYSSASRGVDISDIDFCNMQLHAKRPFNIKLDNAEDEPSPCRRTIRDIRFSNVSGTAQLTGFISGTTEGKIERLRFQNISLIYGGCGTRPDRDENGHWGCRSTCNAIELTHTSDIVFSDVSINYDETASGWKHDISARNCNVLTFNRCHFSNETDEQ